MNCDQVFNVLTRGPFPTGQRLTDFQVEAHLEECPGCWQLAEALRPALDLFQEAIPPAESRDLPGYWGDARPASSVVADLAARSGSLRGGRTALATQRSQVLTRAGTHFEPTQLVIMHPALKLFLMAAPLAMLAGLVWWMGG